MLVSSIMIAQARKNSWSELLTSTAQRRQTQTSSCRINFLVEQSCSVFAKPVHAECSNLSKKETNVLWTIFIVLVILWLLGFSLHLAGGLIHLLLVVALVVLVINLVGGRRSAV